MKWLKTYQDLDLRSEQQVFDYLMNSMSEPLRNWNYFVDWTKVYRHVGELEIHLNIWNYLLGKDNFDDEFRFLIRKHPDIVKAIPALLGRDGNSSTSFSIIDQASVDISYFDFSKPAKTNDEIEKALDFVRKSGLIKIFQSKQVKNIVDFYIGVEVGVDTNGRKNRSGSAMEALVAKLIEGVCKENDWKFLSQVFPNNTNTSWGLKNDFGNYGDKKLFDFAILADGIVTFIEVNIYHSGGSKLSETARAYQDVQSNFRGLNSQFIWITDGRGWQKTKPPLRQAFENIDYILNMELCTSGALVDGIRSHRGKE